MTCWGYNGTLPTMDKNTYTVGEVFRLGLLKNAFGLPYKHKATVSRVIALHGKSLLKKTQFGMGRVVTKEQIEIINRRWE